MALNNTSLLLLFLALLLLASPAAAFGAGNIASLSTIEGHNWRHGDIEDVLATLLFLRGKKWTDANIKRVYFGNWLRDYSQAIDVGTLKGVQADTIRVLVSVLGFMSFGYATREFLVTADRLGVYRPEEHIDNPKDYADNLDARQFDNRLRGPVQTEELTIDPRTGMKNYIANEHGGFRTSARYVKESLEKCIHHGRLYAKGGRSHTEEEKEHMSEALRYLGQALHCLEDFGAHTNYVELVLRELGYHNVFPHTGTQTQINLRGKTVFPLVTGTFGGVDFLHSVLGEVTDTVAQSELEETNSKLGNASSSNTRSRGPGGNSNSDDFVNALSALEALPGLSSYCDQARRLQSQAEHDSEFQGYDQGDYRQSRAPAYQGPAPTFQGPPGSVGGPPGPNIPGINTDPQQVARKIMPILEFRDNLVRSISAFLDKVPGFKKLVDAVTERLTLFIFGLLAPYVQPLIQAASKQLKEGSSSVVDASAKQQYIVWNDPYSTDPTHSMLSKDHFSNVLNSPAGEVAAEIVKYATPRIVYAWEHHNVPTHEVTDDILRAFHHPAIRDPRCDLHNNMFRVVENWSRKRHPYRIDDILSSQSVKDGKNHLGGGGNPHTSSSNSHSHDHSGGSYGQSHGHSQSHHHTSSHTHAHGSSSKPTDPFSTLASNLTSGLNSIPGVNLSTSQFTSLRPFGSSRELYPNEQRNSPNPSPSYVDPTPNAYPQPDPTYGSLPYSAPPPAQYAYGAAPPSLYQPPPPGPPDAFNGTPGPAYGYEHSPQPQPAHNAYELPQHDPYYGHGVPAADPNPGGPHPANYEASWNASGANSQGEPDQHTQGPGGYGPGGYDTNQGGYGEGASYEGYGTGHGTGAGSGPGWFRQ